MNLNKRYISLITIFTSVFSFLDMIKNPHYKKAMKNASINKKFYLILLLAIHNIIYFGVYFSLPLFLCYFNQVTTKHLCLYLLVVILVPLHWYTNNNRCWFTVKQNELLGLDINTGFRDFYAILFDADTKTNEGEYSTLRNSIYYLYLSASIIVTIYLLYIKSNK
jgi:hypothetical protein